MDAKLSAEPDQEGSRVSIANLAGALRGLQAFGPAKLAALGAVGVAVLGLVAMFALSAPTRPNALLYADLDLREADQITEALDHAHIAFDVQGGGSRIMVSPDQVARARMLLARSGLPSGGTVGYELFDRADPLTATQFQQSLNETRALEGELARSIRTISGVRAARVHLVLPRREPFERTARPAQASVLLTMGGPGRLDSQAVQAVLNLVAAAVPGLRQENISLIDSKGTLLARPGHGGDALRDAENFDELRRNAEERMAREVEALLEQTLGPGHVRAEASVEFDNTTLRETQERFDPDQQVVRSTQSTNESSKSTEAPQSVSVQNNLPNADASTGAAGSQTARQDETTNYEIGRTTRVLVRETPQVRRLSVAVIVDNEPITKPDGSQAFQPRSAEELARLTTLVKSAVGFKADRGDQVEIVSMRFNALPEAAPPPTAHLLGLERAELPRVLGNVLLAAVAVLTLLLVVRPVAMRLATAAPALTGPGAGGAEAARALRAEAALAVAGGETFPLESGGDETMMDMNNVAGQVRASSIRRTAQLAERHPEETLSILRAWMAQSEAS